MPKQNERYEKVKKESKQTPFSLTTEINYILEVETSFGKNNG
jgi:hypothetical protein